MIRTPSKKTFAALFAVIMVVSMMAPAAGAAVAGDASDVYTDSGGVDRFDADTERTVEQTEDGVAAQQDPSEVSIDEATRDAFEDPDADSVDVVVRIESADTDGAMSTDAAIDSMKAHAEQTQVDVLRFAESHPGIDVKKQLWLANAVLIEVDPQQTSLDEIAAVEGVERLHENFELTTMDEGAGPADAEEDDADAEPENESEEADAEPENESE